MTDTPGKQIDHDTKFVLWRKAKEDLKNDWSILGWPMASALIFTLMCATNPVVFGVTLLLIAISFSIAQLAISYDHFEETKSLLTTSNENTTTQPKMSYFQHLKITKQHAPADIYRGYTRAAIIATVASLGIMFLAPTPIAILALISFFISECIWAFYGVTGLMLYIKESEKNNEKKDQNDIKQFNALYTAENHSADQQAINSARINTTNETQHFNNKHFTHLDKPYDMWLKNKKSLKNNWNIIRYSSAISIICILFTAASVTTLGTALIAFSVIFGLAQLITSYANFISIKIDDHNTAGLTYWEHLKQTEIFLPHKFAKGKQQISFLTATALFGLAFLAASPAPVLAFLLLACCLVATAIGGLYYSPKAYQHMHTKESNEINTKLQFLRETQNLDTAKARHKGIKETSNLYLMHGERAVKGAVTANKQKLTDTQAFAPDDDTYLPYWKTNANGDLKTFKTCFTETNKYGGNVDYVFEPVSVQPAATSA